MAYKNPKDLDGLLATFMALASDLASHGDRVTAIVCGAFLDDTLSLLLRSHFVDDEKAADKLLVGDSPLGSFSSRIKLAYCMGLFGSDELHDLNQIREIRNRCAHYPINIGFDDGEVADRCRTFKAPGKFMACMTTKAVGWEMLPGPMAPKHSFVLATMVLAAILSSASSVEHATFKGFDDKYDSLTMILWMLMNMVKTPNIPEEDTQANDSRSSGC